MCVQNLQPASWARGLVLVFNTAGSEPQKLAVCQLEVNGTDRS